MALMGKSCAGSVAVNFHQDLGPWSEEGGVFSVPIKKILWLKIRLVGRDSLLCLCLALLSPGLLLSRSPVELPSGCGRSASCKYISECRRAVSSRTLMVSYQGNR